MTHPSRARSERYICQGFSCDNWAEIEILAGKTGGTLGWLCDDCATELENKMQHDGQRNEARLPAEEREP